jgi:hypothetical protein
MRRTLLIVMFALLGFAITLSAAPKEHHSLTIYDQVQVNGTMLKPGDYKVEFDGQTASFMRNGKTIVSTPAKEVAATEKASATQMDIKDNNIKSIQFSGKTDKLVLESPVPGTPAS